MYSKKRKVTKAETQSRASHLVALAQAKSEIEKKNAGKFNVLTFIQVRTSFFIIIM